MQKIRFILFPMLFLLSACGSPEPSSTQSVNIEVTRLVEIEVTREVTREIEVQVETEVTREVEVTRVVEITPDIASTPLPTSTPVVLASAANFLASNFDINSLPEGEEGNLSVIVTAPIDRFGNMPIIVRNNTGGPITNASISATVRSADGSLIGTGDADSLFPYYIVPGGIAIGEMRFDEGITNDAEFEYIVEGDGPGDGFSFGLDLEIQEHNIVGPNIVGFALNSSTEEANLTGLRFMCLDENLALVALDYSSFAQDSIAVGSSAPFSGEIRGVCVNYVLTANGL